MAANLLRDSWTDLDSAELRLFLDERIGGPGQTDIAVASDKFYLPLARELCRVALTFEGHRIVAIEPGPAFDPVQWERLSGEIETSILSGPMKVGRQYSFSSFRVIGSWRGNDSGVQILPPLADAPSAPFELADHPFILEFPIRASGVERITNHRWEREHRQLTLVLNVLLAGGARGYNSRRPEHFWASVPRENSGSEIRWVQKFFFAHLGEGMITELSPPAHEQLEEIDPETYYATVGHDGKGLRVPGDLDLSICLYRKLSPANRDRFDRAAFWMDIASRQWAASVSSSFAALVTAVESLTDRGVTHRVRCEECDAWREHEVPGPTGRFRAFLEKHAPGASLKQRRDRMCGLRSSILHGNELMQMDQNLDFGWDPPGWSQRDLHAELWSLARVSLRNWLRNHPEDMGERGAEP